MFLLIGLMLVTLSFIALLKLVSVLMSEKMILMREEISSFECGFEHHNVSRVPFSLRYFFLTLVFLLFDLEIILMIFLPSVIFSVNYILSFVILFLFIIILFLSLIYEWNDGSLEWVT